MARPSTSETPTSTLTSSDSYVEVRDTGTSAGEGVFALRDLKPGDAVIAIDRPLLSALDSDELEGVCYECLRPKGLEPFEVGLGLRVYLGRGADIGPVALKRCAGCKVVWYCGKACQKSSWSAHHSLECPIFKALHPKTLSGSARAVLRFLLLKNAGKVKPDDWTSFLNCAAPLGQLFRPDRLEELAELKATSTTISKITPFETDDRIVTGMLMRLKINSVTLQTPFHDPIGLAMHPLLAKVNHRCDPNCYVRFPGPNPVKKGFPGASPGDIVVTPLRRIRFGEEITITYIDETWPVRYRKEQLEDRYFFTCSCSKCISEEGEDRRLDPFKTPQLFKLQDEANDLLAMSDSDFPSLEANVKTLTTLISALFKSDKDWPLTRYPFPQLLFQLCILHISAKNFALAVRLIALIHFRIDANVYNSPVHPLRITHVVLLIKMMREVLWGLSPESMSEPHPTYIQLSKEIDLRVSIYMLQDSLTKGTIQTWTEQPWPSLREQHEEVTPEDVVGPGGDLMAAINEETRRLESLCDRTLQSLKRG